MYFNPRTHTGCDPFYVPYKEGGEIYFNPRTHTGCDFSMLPAPPLFIRISIHAPTRGATTYLRLLIIPHYISIHAPTRSATLIKYLHQPLREYFNPRTHTGCDTTAYKRKRPAAADFNPRTHTGCDKTLLTVCGC